MQNLQFGDEEFPYNNMELLEYTQVVHSFGEF
jgi:hypothetical protein